MDTIPWQPQTEKMEPLKLERCFPPEKGGRSQGRRSPSEQGRTRGPKQKEPARPAQGAKSILMKADVHQSVWQQEFGTKAWGRSRPPRKAPGQRWPRRAPQSRRQRGSSISPGPPAGWDKIWGESPMPPTHMHGRKI